MADNDATNPMPPSQPLDSSSLRQLAESCEARFAAIERRIDELESLTLSGTNQLAADETRALDYSDADARLDAIERTVYGSDYALERQALSDKAGESGLRSMVNF